MRLDVQLRLLHPVEEIRVSGLFRFPPSILANSIINPRSFPR